MKLKMVIAAAFAACAAFGETSVLTLDGTNAVSAAGAWKAEKAVVVGADDGTVDIKIVYEAPVWGTETREVVTVSNWTETAIGSIVTNKEDTYVLTPETVTNTTWTIVSNKFVWTTNVVVQTNYVRVVEDSVKTNYLTLAKSKPVTNSVDFTVVTGYTVATNVLGSVGVANKFGEATLTNAWMGGEKVFATGANKGRAWIYLTR